jgi:arylsulfatase A-like enzyme
MGKPNILIIVNDQEYAHPAGVNLPNRDRLRARGVTFNNHQATTTVCTPSRSVMWTGQHTPHTGMWDHTNLVNQDNLDFNEELLAAMNAKLNALISAEVGDYQVLVDVSGYQGQRTGNLVD